ncbi:unnamed protein product [Paramecium sonneborni]|uniref:Transmembrane protein n=1 Tax=Paramecium sonneborni TaxID=65129 RepID=A0A8S1P9B0_9CILI|nr:unnamed protein product [Paramecium sonneborni]
MIFYLLTLLTSGNSVIIDTNLRCACSEILLENDCNSLMNCKWVNNQCGDYIYECYVQGLTNINTYTCNWNNKTNIYEAQKFECSQFKNRFDCSRFKPYCLWNSTEMCNEFTSCQDYDEQRCPIYYKNCSISNKDCINGLQSCQNYLSEQTCRGVQSDELECLWGEDEKCKAQSLKDCSSLTGYKICDINQIECQKNNQGDCVPLTCGDKRLEKDCSNTKIVKQGSSSYYLCVWENGLCQEAKNAQHLNRDTCSKQTAANYKWVNGSCQTCKILQPKILDQQKDGYIESEAQIIIIYLSTFLLSKFVIVFLFID